MAYKFLEGDFNLESAAALTVGGHLIATGSVNDDIQADDITFTGDDGGSPTAIPNGVEINAGTGDFNTFVHIPSATGAQKYISIQNSSNQDLAVVNVASGRTQMHLYASGSKRIWAQATKNGDTHTSAFLKLLDNDGSTARVDLNGKGLIKTVGADGDFTIGGALAVTGHASTIPVLQAGVLVVNGNTNFDATEVSIKDAVVVLNDATNAAGSNNQAGSTGQHLLIGQADVDGAKLNFNHNNGTAGGPALEITQGAGGNMTIEANYFGDASGVTGVSAASMATQTVTGNQALSNGSSYSTGKVLVMTKASGGQTITLHDTTGDTPTVGSFLRIKAGPNCAADNVYTIQVEDNSTDRIGVSGTSIVLKTPHAAVDLVYMGSVTMSSGAKNVWAIF